MTSDDLAALHAASFTTPRPWTASEFTALLADPLVFLVTESGGFLLARAVAGEAEILTLAVAPNLRRQGIGARLIAAFLVAAKARGARQAFLEVSVDNLAAARLYRNLGFSQTGRRKGYFRTPEGRSIDALVFCHNL